MTTVFLSPDPINGTQFIPGTAVPAAGAKLFSYIAGSSTKQDTFVDNTGVGKWSNPIILDSGGNLGGSGEVWIPAGVSVKFVLASFNDTDPPVSPYWTRDNMSGMNDTTLTSTEWIAGPAPTFISATSFTLVGDQTGTFTSGRRIKSTNTAGTRYGTITTSGFTSLTTVTIANDSGTLDSGLSAVWYGILSVNHDSIPNTLSVLRFGAVGDGVTDDHVAVQAAITAAAITGKSVYVPAATYYMGTVGITQTGRIRVLGDGASSFLWSSSFTGTAWTITSNYNILENVNLFMPKSVAAPNAAIVAVDIQGPLNRLRNVICDQTTAGNNSPWYTGVKIGGISNTLEDCHLYTYDTGVLSYGGGARNDNTLIDCEITAQITAGVHFPQTGNVSIIGCDIEGQGLHGIWLEAVSAEIAGATITGNYMERFTTNGIWINGANGFPARGITITGNTINETAATSAVKLSWTVGAVCIGNYIKGGTNSINLDTSNLRYQITPNYISGALISSGTTTPAIGIREDGTLILTLNAFTIVNGTGGVTVAGTYERIGGVVNYVITISTTGTATIASVANTSNISGFPYQSTGYAACSIVDNTTASLGNGLFNTGDTKIFTPVWAANGNEIVISGSYYTTAAGTND